MFLFIIFIIFIHEYRTSRSSIVVCIIVYVLVDSETQLVPDCTDAVQSGNYDPIGQPSQSAGASEYLGLES